MTDRPKLTELSPCFPVESWRIIQFAFLTSCLLWHYDKVHSI